MADKTSRYRAFMYVQQLKYLPFKLTEFKNRLSKLDKVKWCYIVHDKDLNKDGNPVTPHIHCFLYFENDKTLSRVSKLIGDEPNRFEIWNEGINNAYSYLIHETATAVKEKKHHYNPHEVVASFNYLKKIKQIRGEVERKKYQKLNKSKVEKEIAKFASGEISENKLLQSIGVLNFAKNRQEIKDVETVLLAEKHKEFVAKYKNCRCNTFYIFGGSGIGKTELARHYLEKYHPEDFCILGSSRDYFQPYQGEHYIVLNDLRANEFAYSDLLKILDPWEKQKYSASRYHDKPLNLLGIFITTVYSPADFYARTKIADRKVDTLEQLKRRIYFYELKKSNYSQIIKKIRKIDQY